MIYLHAKTIIYIDNTTNLLVENIFLIRIITK